MKLLDDWRERVRQTLDNWGGSPELNVAVALETA